MVARKKGVSNETLLGYLQKDMFMGETVGLDIIREVVGETRMRAIADLPRDQINLDRLDRKLFGKD